jgi:Na+-transporting methylmalonyl-CoA/oxaloacetate decarboxylase gamma subunit
MPDFLINGSTFQKGLLVTLVGMVGVFTVLVVFYLIIRLFIKVFPYKAENGSEK